MAEVIRDTSADIEFLLDALLPEWRDVGEAIREWATLDSSDREDFQLELGPAEERLKRLESYAERNVLGPEQRARYAHLLRMVNQYRPTLERLLAD